MASTSAPVESERDEFETERILTVAGGHFVHDTFSAFVSPLLPVLMEKLSLSLTLAGSLAVYAQIPSLLSVFIGYLADRMSVRYLVIFAPAVTATLASLIGFMPSYTTAAILLFAVGVSIMAFHAPAPAMVAHISGNQVGKGMSFFMAGGELGRSVGPLLVGYGVTNWGIEGLWPLMFFGWFATFVLYFRLHEVSASSGMAQSIKFRVIARQLGRVFGPLFGVMILRNTIVIGLGVYLVVYLTDIREFDLQKATLLLSLYELAGVGGALFGGTISDRIGRKRTIIYATTISAVLMVTFLNADEWMLPILLILLGLTVLSVTPVFQALVQDQLPNNRATGSGMFIFSAFVVRAILTLLIGVLGDAGDLTIAFSIAILISLCSIPVVLLLPDSKAMPST